jgi:hypothetical protein
MLRKSKITSRPLLPLFVLTLAVAFVLALQPSRAQEDCCRGNLLKNGSFSAFTIAASSNFPPSTVNAWLPAFATPQIVSSPLWPGCDGKPGFISMWGNKLVGEGIRQTNVAIQAGHTYRVSACVKVDVTNNALPKYVRLNVRASNGPLSSYTATGPTAPTIGIIGDPSNTPSIAAPGITSTAWLSVTLANWTAPPGVFNTITINPENDNTGDGNTVSWAHVDNVCIQEVRRGTGTGYSNGDPHLTSVNGVRFDFQSAGEFVALRDGNGTEIQVRQSPIETKSSCVSVNTAVAARVGSHRVTFEPNLSGVPDPSGLQLRVDGTLTTLGTGGLNLSGGGRVASSVGDGIQIDFPDGTTLIASPGWLGAESKWYLNLSFLQTPAAQGTLGTVAPGSWLPALANGTSLGPQPSSSHQRYVDLYQTFADSWRVTDSTSLFDYAPGTSTATFTIAGWPDENGACKLRENRLARPVRPIDPKLAMEICRAVVDKDRNDECVFDVVTTGEAGFAKQAQFGRSEPAVEKDSGILQVDPRQRGSAVRRAP